MSISTILNKEFKVHDLGFVRVVDSMGSDAAICQMARVSYGAGTKSVNEDRGLIRYLMKHKHTSPFEGCVLKLHIKMPIFVARQWVRHRTASLNEYSARYSEMKDEFFIPTQPQVQGQSKTNKQGSSTMEPVPSDDKATFIHSITNRCREAYETYKYALGSGIAREMARIGLPVNIYTEMYWQMNLHNLLHFCALRSDPHAQKEIRDYSDIILHEIISVWCPDTYQAFMDYVMNARTFSAQEMSLIIQMTGEIVHIMPKDCDGWSLLTEREQIEFEKKIGY